MERGQLKTNNTKRGAAVDLCLVSSFDVGLLKRICYPKRSSSIFKFYLRLDKWCLLIWKFRSNFYYNLSGPTTNMNVPVEIACKITEVPKKL